MLIGGTTLNLLKKSMPPKGMIPKGIITKYASSTGDNFLTLNDKAMFNLPFRSKRWET